MKKNIFLVLVTAIICISGTAFAYSYNSSEVGYKNASIEDALDELYTKASTYKNLSTNTTATSSDLLLNKTAYNKDGELVIGNIATFTPASSYTPSASTQTLSTAGKYMAGDIIIDGVTPIEPSTYNTLTHLDNKPSSSSTSLSLNKGSYVCQFSYSISAHNQNPGESYKDVSSSFTVTPTGCDTSENVTSLAKLQYSRDVTNVQDKSFYQGTILGLSVFKCNINSNKTVSASFSSSGTSTTQGFVASLVCTKY